MPAATVKSGMSLVTIEPAAITQCLPIFTFGMTCTLCPSHEPLPITTGPGEYAGCFLIGNVMSSKV